MKILVLLLTLFPSVAALGQDSWNVSKLCLWNDTSLVPENSRGQRYNDTWGFTVNGREYAAIGSTIGVHVIDVNTCKQVAFHPGKHRGEVIHRDYKTYRNYLYAVCDQGESSLQVFNLSYLPDSMPLVYESTLMELITSHNIFIDTAKGSLYTCSAMSMFGHNYMRRYSLANPELPKLTHVFDFGAPVHDVFVRNDTAWCSSGMYGLQVVDFNDSSGYRRIAELTSYVFQGYNHSSWINDKGIAVMADETHGLPIKVLDVRNQENLRTLSTFMPREDSTCIPHNPFLLGDYALISYYQDGFQIYDLSDPVHPRRVGYYDTYPGDNRKSFSGAWGCYPYLPSGRILVSDMQSGLFVFDVSGAIPRPDSGFPIPIIPVPGEWEVFPNPFSENLNIYLPAEDVGVASYTVYSITGYVVAQGRFDFSAQTIQPIRLTLPGNLTAGTYLLTLQAGRQVYKQKITKR